jgi:hypothetical protein
MSWWWVWLVVGLVGVAVLAGLRWALADFLLDRFGSRRMGWSRALRADDHRPSVPE